MYEDFTAGIYIGSTMQAVQYTCITLIGHQLHIIHAVKQLNESTQQGIVHSILFIFRVQGFIWFVRFSVVHDGEV